MMIRDSGLLFFGPPCRHGVISSQYSELRITSRHHVVG